MTRPLQTRLLALGAGVALWLGHAAAAAQGQVLEEPEDGLDCVIEPHAIVKLGSVEEGILREITVDRGDNVERGDVVARLDSDLQVLAVELAKLRAESDFEVRAGQARLSFRQDAADRVAALYKKSIVSTKVRDEAEIELELAELGVNAAQTDRRMARLELRNARARLARRTIRSPVDGVVGELTMSAGEFVHEQSPVVTIAQINPLNVEVFVPISRYGRVEVGMFGEVVPEEPIGGTYRARVTVVDWVFDAASGTFGVRLALPNADYGLPAGLKCRVRFLPRDAAPPDDAPAGPDADADDLRALSPRSEVVLGIQSELRRTGYDPGPADGFMGPKTRIAIEAYQRDRGLGVDGRPSTELLKLLRSDKKGAGKKGQG